MLQWSMASVCYHDDMLCQGKVSVPTVRYTAYRQYQNMVWNLLANIDLNVDLTNNVTNKVTKSVMNT